MRFFRSITFQIWAPYAALFFLLALAVALYYPATQYELLRNQKRKELTEMARAISVGIELSLEAGNYAGLEKTLGYFAGSEDDVSVLVLSSGENPLKPEVIAYFPQDLSPDLIMSDSVTYFKVKQPFNSSAFSGTVEVVIPEQVIKELVAQLNYPVYLLLVLSVIVAGLLFYFVALRVSKPIGELTIFSESLMDKDLRPEKTSHQGNEIGTLRQSLLTLKESLNKQKEVNRRLLDGLESEVKLRTDELRSAVDKLNQAQLSARLGNFIYWFNSDQLSLSENLNQFLGNRADSFKSLSDFLDLLNSSGKNQVKPLFKNSDRPGHRFSLDLRLADEVVWINMTGQVRHDEKTGELYIGGTIQDITDRKSAEAEVSKLSLVAKLSTNGIIITDRQRRIIWVNQSTERLTGYSLSELIGKSPKMFQFAGTDPLTLEKIRIGLQNKRKIREEVLNRSKSGNTYWVELHIEPFFDEFGELEGYLAIEVDVTDRKRYEEELKNALEKEKEVSQLKTRFITMTSHEFRTPLTTIQSNAELLQFHFNKLLPDPQDKAYRFIGRINSEITRLTSLMNDILLLGRIDSGKLSFKPQPVDLKSMIEDLVQRNFVPNDDRLVKVNFIGHPVLVNLDPSLFNHVLTNLFSNALKYSSGKRSPECTVEFLAEKVLIAITDFGIGIPEADLPKIFESFHRGRNAENIQGTGLGLQIVKQFVEMHNGTIKIESKENIGTTIIVEIAL